MWDYKKILFVFTVVNWVIIVIPVPQESMPWKGT